MYEKTPSSHHVARLYRPGSGRRYTLAGGVTLALQQGSLLATLSAFWAEPILFVLNLWPVAALALLFYFFWGTPGTAPV